MPNPSDEKPLDLGDAAGLKRKLDETAVKVITGSGYVENFTTSNVKLALGFAAVAIALLAQFYPKKYPDNKILLIICVTLYVIVTTVLNHYTAHHEGDSILHTNPPRAGQSTVGLKVCSRLPRHSYDYTLSIAPLVPHSKPVSSMTKSLTEFFDVNGFLVHDKFAAHVERLLEEYDAKRGGSS